MLNSFMFHLLSTNFFVPLHENLHIIKLKDYEDFSH